MTPTNLRWEIVTGEYPPQPGGVADHTRRLAAALAAQGDAVRVWAPPCSAASPVDPGVTVQRLPDHFGPRGLATLGRALRDIRGQHRLLVQYVPHMYAWRGMNLGFAFWLRTRCPVRPWVMFHEVRFPVSRRQPLRHNVLGVTQSLMARLVNGAAGRVFVSTPAWGPLLQSRPVPEWLPVPSNIEAQAGSAAADVVRADLAVPTGGCVVGHFGTFGGAVADTLAEVLPPLLRADGRRRALLIGRGGEAFVARLKSLAPDVAGQLRATGGVSAEAVAAQLQACDLLVQPYPEGVTGRRTSVMASLALGLPVVTTTGPLTEELWREEPMAALAPAGNGHALLGAVEQLLAQPRARLLLGRQAKDGYRRHFSIERTIAVLRGMPPVATQPHLQQPASVS